MNMGFYTAKLDRKRTVLATSEPVNVRYHRYESIDPIPRLPRRPRQRLDRPQTLSPRRLRCPAGAVTKTGAALVINASIPDHRL
jgi:hypothetical protein